MIATTAALLCSAYILGLLLTGSSGAVAGIPIGAIVMLVSGVLLAGSIRRIWRTAPKPWVWLAAGLVGMVAVLYFQFRLPQPSATDICHWVPAQAESTCQASPLATEDVEITGKITSAPQLTRSQRLKFELAAAQIKSPLLQPVTGKLYVTVPRALGEQLYPGLTVAITGSLYQPKPATNPGGFDFEKYLAQQGIFTGLNGTRIEYPSDKKPAASLFWTIRQRIVQSQRFGLSSSEGALVSAMVMGKNAVDVPYEIQDQFKQTGLAHALAASGTQVTLLVSLVLALTKRFSSLVRCGLGVSILVMYVGLTGVEASVLRAGVMGGVALLALLIERKVKPTGSLLFAAVALLALNPLWIWDLGFQLSFLATLGLLVTVPIITRWLDWLPSAIAPLFAIPIAAYLWTLPLMLLVFGVISPYSILVNIIVSPLITIISIGGMISAVAALLHPAAGSFLAWLLYYPAHGLIKIAEIGSQLPGSNVAIGTINTAQILLLYGLIVLVWRWQLLHRYWWLAGLIGIGLVAVPAGYTTVNLSRVTVLATAEKPVLVVQDRGRTGLIHSGDAKDAAFTVLPFLQKQGINQLDWAVAPSTKATEIEAWQQISNAKPISRFYASPGFSSTDPGQPAAGEATLEPAQAYRTLLAQVNKQGTALPLSIGQELRFGAATIQQIYTKPDILQIRFNHHTWLWLEAVPALKRQPALAQRLTAVEVIGWSGKALSPQLLEKLNPQAAVMFGESTDPATETWLTRHRVAIYPLKQGAIEWTADGFADAAGE